MKKIITLLIATFMLVHLSASAGNPYATQKPPKLLKAQSPTILVKDVKELRPIKKLEGKTPAAAEQAAVPVQTINTKKEVVDQDIHILMEQNGVKLS